MSTLVVKILGAVLLVTVLAIAALAVFQLGVPDVLQNVAVGSLTGLVGLLVPSPRGKA